MNQLEVRIDKGTRSAVHLALLFNGELISGHCGITIRVSEIVPLLHRLEPDVIVADQEMITEVIAARIRDFKQTVFI